MALGSSGPAVGGSGPEMLSKVEVLDGAVLQKSKKRHAIARWLWEALGQLWAALAELWEVLGEHGRALYIHKLPINRPSGRYVI